METVKEIQTTLNALRLSLTAKGKAKAEATMRMASDEQPTLMLTFEKLSSWYGSDTHYEWFRHKTIAGAFSDAKAWVAKMPDAAEERRNTFASLVAKAIDYGRDNGIDKDLVSPLAAALKKITENAITHQPIQPAE